MALGGVLAGMLVAGIAGAVSRFTTLKEDASLAAIYLVALALGVTLISARAPSWTCCTSCLAALWAWTRPGCYWWPVWLVSVLALAWMYRALVLETFDPVFLNANRRSGLGAWVWQQGFLMLVVVNLVAGFQTLGTLMAVGLMMLPAVSARLWHDTLPAQLINASIQAALASVAGLLLSYHFDTPSGPTIIGCAGKSTSCACRDNTWISVRRSAKASFRSCNASLNITLAMLRFP
jgi:zinc/manganese transport system permease protein